MNKILDYQFIEQLKSLAFIDEIWIFGSRARGDNREKADIDLAIVCPSATDDDWMKVSNIIEEADTLLKIDCVKFNQQNLSKELYDNILRDRKVIYVKK